MVFRNALWLIMLVPSIVQGMDRYEKYSHHLSDHLELFTGWNKSGACFTLSHHFDGINKGKIIFMQFSSLHKDWPTVESKSLSAQCFAAFKTWFKEWEQKNKDLLTKDGKQ